jgi:hypothetical protein
MKYSGQISSNYSNKALGENDRLIIHLTKVTREPSPPDPPGKLEKTDGKVMRNIVISNVLAREEIEPIRAALDRARLARTLPRA